MCTHNVADPHVHARWSRNFTFLLFYPSPLASQLGSEECSSCAPLRPPYSRSRTIFSLFRSDARLDPHAEHYGGEMQAPVVLLFASTRHSLPGAPGFEAARSVVHHFRNSVHWVSAGHDSRWAFCSLKVGYFVVWIDTSRELSWFDALGLG
jgi:hypothetical protein